MAISGSITALATPFHDDGSIDLDAWRRLLLLQLDGGTQGVVVAGSTGEAAALSDEEFDRLLTTALETVGGQMTVLAGTGQMNTLKTIAQTRRAAAAGAQLALVVTPPYVRPTQAGLIEHYTAVADEGGLPVVLYNVPGRTGCDLLPETVAQLVDHSNIVGIKEAVNDPDRMTSLLALQSEGFAILSGDDPTACRALLAGADGLISVGSNALPRAFRRLCDLARHGDRDQAEAWDASMQAIYSFLGAEPNPIPVKALLQRLGYGKALRLPLLPLSSANVPHADLMADRVRALEAQCSRDPLAA